MSPAPNRRPAPRVYLLARTAEGTAELLSDGETLWSSDTDPDLLDELGTDALRDDDLGDVLEYLIAQKYLTSDEADECIVDSPEDDDGPGDDDDDDEGDEGDE
jgi:hypothetical protein